MKKFLFSCSLLIIYSQINMAQNNRVLSSYDHTASISIQQNEALITIDGNSNSIPIINNDNKLAITDANAVKLLQHLQFSEIHKQSLKNQYDTINAKELNGLNLATQLINRAKQLGSINFVNNQHTSTDNRLQLVDDAIHNNELVSNNNNEEFIEAKKQNSSWLNWLPWLTSIVAIGLGYALGKYSGTNEQTVEIAYETENNQTATNKNVSPKITKKQITVKELRELDKQKTKELKELNNNLQNLLQAHIALENKHTTMQQEKKQLFDAVQAKLVTPYMDALNQNNISKVMESALKGMAHLTSIARDAQNLKQAYDQTNLQFLINGNTDSSSKIIDAHTNKDEIPKNVQNIIELMRKNNITQIENTSFLGYTIKQI